VMYKVGRSSCGCVIALSRYNLLCIQHLRSFSRDWLYGLGVKTLSAIACTHLSEKFFKASCTV
jgi:hypothetical protein